jgi:hypothetical protein
MLDEDSHGSGGSTACTDCGTGSTTSSSGGSGATTGSGGSGAGPGKITYGEFELVDEFDGPCEYVDGDIDVNLGNSAEAAVRALHCQITGSEPDPAFQTEWADKLRTTSYVRRIDVARTFCQMQGRACGFKYSDPWKAQVSLEDGCTRSTDRDMGAVLMFWGNCPGDLNCSMDWANTHAEGMKQAHELFAFGPNTAGYYNPGNAGFWRRELLDARWAGLQFLLLNVFGFDIQQQPYPLTKLTDALGEVDSIQIALFDDTWAWGNRDEAPWDVAPSFDNLESTAQALYNNSWKPFFEGVPKERWYLRDGKPLIYFYNAGTLHPANNSQPVLARMKELFDADFGVEPFLAVDQAFFQDNRMEGFADGRFIWNSGAGRDRSSYTMSNTRLDHSMVRWDSMGRDQAGAIATSTDRIFKGPDDLNEYLATSADADMAVIATWNDLGEGTGIARNYDYYSGGEWLPPHAFMSLIRQSQCSN